VKTPRAAMRAQPSGRPTPRPTLRAVLLLVARRTRFVGELVAEDVVEEVTQAVSDDVVVFSAAELVDELFEVEDMVLLELALALVVMGVNNPEIVKTP
jgi:hypothetical protein